MRSLNCKATLTSVKHILSAVDSFNPSKNTVYKSFFGGEQRHENPCLTLQICDFIATFSTVFSPPLVFVGAFTWESE